MPATIYQRRSIRTAAIAALQIVAASLQADVLVLESGGRVEGQWVNQQEQTPAKYEFRRAGMTLSLPAGQVREAVRQSPAELEYSRRMPTVPDTVEAQWDLAEWCRKSGLTRERESHLRRIVELNPNHQPARFALGYIFLKGEWITQSDSRRQEGYELYRGKWRTPQEIEILESRSRNELAEKEWLGRLKRWRRDLDDREKSKLAYESLMAINDPAAIEPLGQFFTREKVRSVKQLYADVLARFNNKEATRLLVERALSDPDEEIFHYCVDRLRQLEVPHLANAFIVALKDNNNARVNRGAIALARLRDKSAISPLIDALTTTYSRVINNGPGADATTASFGSGGAFMSKGDGAELQVFHVQNQAVLDALTTLAGVNFGFDQRAWRYWHAQEKIARESSQPTVDARRQ
jgi:hypothetical protein